MGITGIGWGPVVAVIGDQVIELARAVHVTGSRVGHGLVPVGGLEEEFLFRRPGKRTKPQQGGEGFRAAGSIEPVAEPEELLQRYRACHRLGLGRLVPQRDRLRETVQSGATVEQVGSAHRQGVTQIAAETAQTRDVHDWTTTHVEQAN
ncbi:MAG: hypothetical protein ACYDGR_09345 [Candidatus Dormibacteria bacterium]